MSIAAALEKGNYRHLDYLVRAGLNVDTATKRGETPLILCCYIEDEARRQHCAHLLLGREADVGLADPAGRNALMHACLTGRRRLVELYLLPECVDFDLVAKDKDGNTALHHAVLSGNPDIVRSMTRALGKYGLGTSEPNNLGLTPYGLGRKLGFLECCDVLSEGRRNLPPTHVNMHNIHIEMPSIHEVASPDRLLPTEMSGRSQQPASAKSVMMGSPLTTSTPGDRNSSVITGIEIVGTDNGGGLTSWKVLEQLYPIRSVVLSKSYRQPAVPPPPPTPTTDTGRGKPKPSRRSTNSSQSSRKSGAGSPFWRTACESPRGTWKGSRSPSRNAAVASPLLSPKNSFGTSGAILKPLDYGRSSAGVRRTPLRNEESIKPTRPTMSSPRQSRINKVGISLDTGPLEKPPTSTTPLVTRSAEFELIRMSSVSQGNKVATVFDTKAEQIAND